MLLNKAKKKTSVEMQWASVSPKLATAILEHTVSSGFPQRPLSKPTARRYANEMEHGTWHKNTADVVRLCNYKGAFVALDGQHRLKAIEMSGQAQDTWVAIGVPEDAFKYVDQGAPRTLSHVIGAAGWPNSSTMAATALMLKKQEAGLNPTTDSGSVSSLCSGSMFDWVCEKHSDLRLMWESYGQLIKKAATRCHVSEAGMTYMFYMMEKVDHDRSVLLFRFLAESYDTAAPSKVYQWMLKVLDDNNNKFASLRAQQMKVRSDAQRYLQMQTIRFSWLCDLGAASNPKTQAGFMKTYNKWMKDVGSTQPWSYK